MMSWTETGEQRFAYMGSKLVTHQYDKDNRQQDQNCLTPILFIHQTKQDGDS